jgi:hypothetical protein
MPKEQPYINDVSHAVTHCITCLGRTPLAPQAAASSIPCTDFNDRPKAKTNCKGESKTYSNGHSRVVTHLTTNVLHKRDDHISEMIKTRSRRVFSLLPLIS